MLVFIEQDFTKSVGQSVKNKAPKIDYQPSKSAKSKASKAANNSDPDVKKQLDLIRKKNSAA
jgi:hypothetical protein